MNFEKNSKENVDEFERNVISFFESSHFYS